MTNSNTIDDLSKPLSQVITPATCPWITGYATRKDTHSSRHFGNSIFQLEHGAFIIEVIRDRAEVSCYLYCRTHPEHGVSVESVVDAYRLGEPRNDLKLDSLIAVLNEHLDFLKDAVCNRHEECMAMTARHHNGFPKRLC